MFMAELANNPLLNIQMPASGFAVHVSGRIVSSGGMGLHGLTRHEMHAGGQQGCCGPYTLASRRALTRYALLEMCTS